MPIGWSDGTQTESMVELYDLPKLDDKQRSDLTEINSNQKSGDFQSRWGGLNAEGRQRVMITGEDPKKTLNDNNVEYIGDPIINPGETYPEGYLLDKWLGSTPESRAELERGLAKTTIPQMTKSIWEALKLPGEVYEGKIDPTSEEGIGRAFELASLAVMGPAPVAAKVADGSLGSFVGVRSKTADRTALYKAQNKILDGEDVDKVFMETGWFQGADKRWRYEIPDNKAKIISGTDDAIHVLPERYNEKAVKDYQAKNTHPDMNPEFTQVPFPIGWEKTKLSSVLDHPELYKAHPWLKDINVVPLSPKDPHMASWDVETKTIHIKDGGSKSSLIHEIQHAIQDHEGFARGGNPEQFGAGSQYFAAIREETNAFRDKLLEKQAKGEKISEKDLDKLTKIVELSKKANDKYFAAHEKYRQIMGETEAYNTEHRLPMSDMQRRATPPTWTQEYANSEQNMINGLGSTFGKVKSPAPAKIETIEEAAIKVGDNIYKAKVHFDAYTKAAEKHSDNVLNKATEGFVTSEGRFVTRKEATKIAYDAEQTLFKTPSKNEELDVASLKRFYTK